MNGHLRRLPNNCGFIDKYSGSLLGLKTILYLLSSVYSNEHINTTCKFKYKDLNIISNVFSHQGRKFICKTIVDSVYLNEIWLSEYANIKFDEQHVYVDYTDKMIQICQLHATNYYLFDTGTIFDFNYIGAIKLYLIYRRNLFIHNYNKGLKVFSCNNETFCNIFPKYTSYRILRHAVNVAVKDFTRVTDIPVEVTKRDNMWKITYNDIVIYNKHNELPDIDDYDEDELEDI